MVRPRDAEKLSASVRDLPEAELLDRPLNDYADKYGVFRLTSTREPSV